MGTWARNNSWKYIKIGPEADDLPVATPSGKKTITSTSEVDVAAYATAQVVDENLTAENIKKDVVILGTTGSYEGSGGSSDFSTAEITLNFTPPSGVTITTYAIYSPKISYDGTDYVISTPDMQGNLTSDTNTLILILADDGNGAKARITSIDTITCMDAEGNFYVIDGTPTLSGDITEVPGSEYNYYVVTGDCSITANVVLDE